MLFVYENMRRFLSILTDETVVIDRMLTKKEHLLGKYVHNDLYRLKVYVKKLIIVFD